MRKNMGSADRIIRVIIAVGVGILYLTKVITGTAAIVLIIVAAVFLITGFVGVCPAYNLFGINRPRK